MCALYACVIIHLYVLLFVLDAFFACVCCFCFQKSNDEIKGDRFFWSSKRKPPAALWVACVDKNGLSDAFLKKGPTTKRTPTHSFFHRKNFFRPWTHSLKRSRIVNSHRFDTSTRISRAHIRHARVSQIHSSSEKNEKKKKKKKRRINPNQRR